MKSDNHGCSTCTCGSESYERFYMYSKKKFYIQYDYRTSNGILFTTVKPSLTVCRIARDMWLSSMKLNA